MEDIFSGYPILNYVHDNKLTRGVYSMMPDSSDDSDAGRTIEQGLIFFTYRELDVFKLSHRVQSELCVSANFNRDKALLWECKECSGLLLLEDTMLPELGEESSNYPIHAIFYSWLSHAEHDRVSGLKAENELYEDEGRTLLLLPMYGASISKGTDMIHLLSDAEDFGTCNAEGILYSKIHDFVMSFILLNAFKEVYDELLFERPLKRSILEFGKNLIHLIE